jgi:Leucine-rich repeat (LRR) protein
VRVDLQDGQANDAVMAQVGRLGGLEQLVITAPDGDLSDAGVAHLRGLSHLRNFSLGEGTCRVTGAVLADLAGAGRLQVLYLDRVRLNDADLVHLNNYPDLRRLSLTNCEITGVGLGHVEKLASLRLLSLRRCPISDAGLAYLVKFPRLEYVSVSGSVVTDGGIARLRAARPEMRINR